MINNKDDQIQWPGWETVGLIGRGSFGAVYEIQRDVFGEVEKAALKIISIPQNSSDVEELYGEGYDEESITSTFKSHLKSIITEYSLMRKMSDSVNIVNCEDVRYVHHEDGIGWDIFIKMELLTPLTKSLSGNISEETVVKLGVDMCRALEMCSKYDIVHRDIKPQNIFMSAEGDYKLGDFGIAKTVEKTMCGTKIGTYKYMAPEVYNNQPYGAGADIYSLGLVLYWLLNERRMPFLPLPPEKLKAGMDDEARHRRLQGEMLPQPAHGSKALKAVVLKACAYNPADRFSSPKEMRLALETALRGGDPPKPEPPKPEPTPEPTPEPKHEPKPKTSTQKKRVVVPIVITGLVCTLAVTVGMLIASHRGNKSEAVNTVASVSYAESAEQSLPTEPRNLTVVEYDIDSARVSWSASTNADYYEVQYYSPRNSTWKDDKNYTSGTSYVSNGLNSYASYDFRVRAVNAAGASDWVQCTYVLDLELPGKPTNLMARESDWDSARLSWNESSYAEYYEVQYYSPLRETWVDDADYSSGTSYVSHNLTSYISYEFRVRAVNVLGCSDWVECTYVRDIEPPSSPKNFHASEYTLNSAVLTWSASNYADYYEVQYYSPVSSAWKDDADYSSGTSYISGGLGNYLSYEYRVRACNAAGYSDWVYCVYTLDIEFPGMPTNLTAAEHGSESAYISWNESPYAEYYEVQYYSPVNGEWKNDKDYTSGTSYISSGLSSYDSYEYRVRAVNALGYSSWAECTYFK